MRDFNFFESSKRQRQENKGPAFIELERFELGQALHNVIWQLLYIRSTKVQRMNIVTNTLSCTKS